MAGSRYGQVAKGNWQYLDQPFSGIDADLSSLEAMVVAGTDITVTQLSGGGWPTITRQQNAHYRWFAAYDATKPPAAANGAATGDELVTPTGTTSIA